MGPLRDVDLFGGRMDVHEQVRLIVFLFYLFCFAVTVVRECSHIAVCLSPRTVSSTILLYMMFCCCVAATCLSFHFHVVPVGRNRTNGTRCVCRNVCHSVRRSSDNPKVPPRVSDVSLFVLMLMLLCLFVLFVVLLFVFLSRIAGVAALADLFAGYIDANIIPTLFIFIGNFFAQPLCRRVSKHCRDA